MPALSRRQFFKKSFIATALSTLPLSLWAATRQPLFIPPLMETRRGRPIFLTMQAVDHALESGKNVEVWGFNGQYLGPTVKIRQGDFAKVNYRNNLSQAVALNIQGIQASGELLGGVGRVLQPKETWSPIIPVTQSAATCWYHSVTLANSAYQTYRGLVGMWIIEDNESRKSPLPQKYGVNDIPLILQDMRLNSNGLQLFQQNDHSFLGNRLFVNGQEAPYLTVPRGWVRLRLVNASLSRSYELRCDDERDLHLIAQDQGFLPQAKQLKSILLAPSERIEILIDLNEGDNVSLIAGEKRHFMHKFTALFASEDELIENTVLELRPEGLASVFSQQTVTQFNTDAVTHLSAQIVQERHFHFDVTTGTINDKHFDPRRVTTAKLGSTERWILTATQPMGFRIQGAKFVLEKLDDKPLELNEIAWKDSIWIAGKVQLLVKFDNVSSNNHPFIFGSSNLMLADKGCIRLLVVQ
ncbi:multicopper oxidase domain-containing protein [Pasteurella canis]|uniref:multicopper oxidase domain-containing protein n=1 Tax=Pasteurella canis TaxID=753 RepID=UPI001CBCDC37|nr:multicopper oxidase domain-containing protein [Pasteurella canis]UAX41415.1 multicopper oxidase domain-containing protein [Pasteurella canis]